MKESTGNTVAGFIFGAALGLATGVLFAPRSGDETRKRIHQKAKEYTDDVSHKLSEKIDDLREHVDEAGKEAKAKVKKPKTESEKQ